MRVGIYHNGSLVVEEYGSGLITRENGRYCSMPYVASRNPPFEKWLDQTILEIEQKDLTETLAEPIE